MLQTDYQHLCDREKSGYKIFEKKMQQKLNSKKNELYYDTLQPQSIWKHTKKEEQNNA